MNQIKQALTVLRKYHFWILCVVILGLYIGVWFMSTSDMSQQTETLAGKIEAAFKTGEQISGIVNHPNTDSANMMKRLNRAEAEQVRLAWEARFREQEDVLKWPEKLLPDFIAAVEPLKPIEATVKFPTPPNEELRLEFRNRYRDYIRDELPKLAEIIGAVWGATGSASGSRYPGAGGGMPREALPAAWPHRSGCVRSCSCVHGSRAAAECHLRRGQAGCGPRRAHPLGSGDRGRGCIQRSSVAGRPGCRTAPAGGRQAVFPSQLRSRADRLHLTLRGESTGNLHHRHGSRPRDLTPAPRCELRCAECVRSTGPGTTAERRCAGGRTQGTVRADGPPE